VSCFRGLLARSRSLATTLEQLRKVDLNLLLVRLCNGTLPVELVAQCMVVKMKRVVETLTPRNEAAVNPTAGLWHMAQRQ
jgi:hypothetical protein